MSDRVNVAVCSTPHFPHLEPIFDALCDALRQEGYAYHRVSSHKELLASPSLIARTDVLACFGGIPIGAEVLHEAQYLRGVVSCVSGTDGIDLKTAGSQGILVAHAPTYENYRGMAEAAVMLILHLMYDLDGTRRNMQEGRHRPQMPKARLLHGKTIGLVGWGRISSMLASLLQNWGVKILVYSRRGSAADFPSYAQPASLHEVLSESDAVCVLAGAEANAPPLINREGLALMKRSAYFINLSRGSTVDEQGLTDTLKERRIAGAALDVFAVEPLAADSALRSCPNVILTSHHVGHTQEGDHSLIPAMLNNVFALLQGRVPPLVRNSEAIDNWRSRWQDSPAAPLGLERKTS